MPVYVASSENMADL